MRSRAARHAQRIQRLQPPLSDSCMRLGGRARLRRRVGALASEAGRQEVIEAWAASTTRTTRGMRKFRGARRFRACFLQNLRSGKIAVLGDMGEKLASSSRRAQSSKCDNRRACGRCRQTYWRRRAVGSGARRRRHAGLPESRACVADRLPPSRAPGDTWPAGTSFS